MVSQAMTSLIRAYLFTGSHSKKRRLSEVKALFKKRDIKNVCLSAASSSSSGGPLSALALCPAGSGGGILLALAAVPVALGRLRQSDALKVEPFYLTARSVARHHRTGGHAAAQAVARLFMRPAAKSCLVLSTCLGTRRRFGCLLWRGTSTSRSGKLIAGSHSTKALTLLLLLLFHRHRRAPRG